MKRSLSNMPIAFVLLLLSYIFGGFVGIIMIVFDFHKEAAVLVVNSWITLSIITSLVYIVFFDSKKRWPNLSARQRAGNVLTFKR